MPAPLPPGCTQGELDEVYAQANAVAMAEAMEWMNNHAAHEFRQQIAVRLGLIPGPPNPLPPGTTQEEFDSIYSQLSARSTVFRDHFLNTHWPRYLRDNLADMIATDPPPPVGGEPDPDAQAWADNVIAAGGTVSSGVLFTIDAFVKAEKAAGTWDLTDDYWVFAVESSMQARVSLKFKLAQPAVVGGTPLFTPFMGYTFDGSSNWYNTGFIPNGHNVAMTNTEMRLAVYERGTASIAGVSMGADSTANRVMNINARTAAGTVTGRMNCPASLTFGSGIISADGMTALSRTGTAAGDSKVYRNGSEIAYVSGGSPLATTTLAAHQLYIGANDQTGTAVNFRNSQVAFACAGAYLTAGQELAQYDNVQAMIAAFEAMAGTLPPEPADIVLRSQSSAGYQSRPGLTGVPAPAGIVDGDILLVYFVNVGTDPVAAPVPPAGFASFGTATSVVAAGTNGRAHVFWKRAASEAAAFYDFTHPTMPTACWMGCYTGCKTTGLPLGADSGNTGIGTTSTGTGITTTAAKSVLLWMGHDWGDTTNNLTPPTGMTERLDAVVIYVADQMVETAGATGDRTMTNNSIFSNPWAVRMVELLAEPA